MLITRLLIVTAVVVAAVTANRVYAVPPTQLQKQASWELPTTRTDGSILDITELSETRVYCGTDDASLTLVTSIPAPDTSTTLSLPLDTMLCAVTAVDTDGLESAYSNSVPVKGQPNPPGNLVIMTITIHTQ